uniref:Uncharacterized protein n=1 Tax=Anguilla anguilla TaxID=7936 RepID=A0A0E9QFL7_ANGAN
MQNGCLLLRHDCRMSVSLGYSYFKNMQSVQMVIEWFNRGKSNVGIFFQPHLS